MTHPQKTGTPAAQRSLDRLVEGAGAVKSGAATPAEAYRAAIAPGLTAAHFTARELETLRKACRDSDFEHLWRDFVQPAIARAAT